MRILWVGTKAPWPPLDGGRLVALLTLEALRAHGHELTIVSPVDPGAADRSAIAARLESVGRAVLVSARPAGLAAAALRTAFGATPLTVRRHSLPAVRDEVAGLLSRETFDVVHAEQPQALAQVAGVGRLRVPVVLRAQNVESDLWRGASCTAGFLRPVLAREARRLAVFEGRAAREATATVALTAHDASRLAELSGVDGAHPPRAGAVSVAAAGGRRRRSRARPRCWSSAAAGWRPNEEGARWFLRTVWPRVRAALPGAVLHVVGAPVALSEGILGRPAIPDSREVFAEGAVLVVPVHVASGVRMKILEAWARGVPVVSTPAGARGLEATDGRELLLADDPEAFVHALRRLHGEPTLATALVAAGRDRLASHHDAGTVAARLTAVYTRAVSSGRR